MNIDDLTIGQARQIAALFGTAPAPSAEPAAAPFTPHVGNRCIVRTYASGVHFGTLAAQDGRQVELTDARRLWRWFARDGISLSEVSQNGIIADKSRIAQAVPSITILDALEIIPCSDAAIVSIEGAEVALP